MPHEPEFDDRLLRTVAELYFSWQPGRKLNYAALLKELRSKGYKISDKKIDDLVRSAGRRLLLIEADHQKDKKGRDFLDAMDYLRRNKEGWGLTRVIIADATPDDLGPNSEHRATCKAAADFYNSLVDYARVRDEEIHILIGGGTMILDSLVLSGNRPYEHLYLYASAMIPRCSPNSRLPAPPAGPEANVITAWLNAGRDSRKAYYATTSVPEVTLPEPHDDPRRRHESNCNLMLDHTRRISKDSQYASLLRKCEKVDVAFLAFGILDDRQPDILFKDSQTVPAALVSCGINPDYLIEGGAIGTLDYCILGENRDSDPGWQFFLNAGYPDATSLYRNMVANGDIVVGIGNIESLDAIVSALHARLINVLITDRETASRVTTLGFLKVGHEFLESQGFPPDRPEEWPD